MTYERLADFLQNRMRMSHVYSERKALFTKTEWSQRNQYFADTEGLELDSVEMDVTMDGSTGGGGYGR